MFGVIIIVMIDPILSYGWAKKSLPPSTPLCFIPLRSRHLNELNFEEFAYKCELTASCFLYEICDCMSLLKGTYLPKLIRQLERKKEKVWI